MVSLDKLVLATIVFFVFIIGGVFLVDDIETSYDDFGVDMGINEYMLDTYKTATDNSSSDYSSFDLAQDSQTRLFDKEVTDTDTESSMFAGSFSVIKLITTPARLMNTVLNQISVELNIPQEFVGYAFAALIITITFSVIFLIFRVRS